ncbi:MAG: hypothetical protein A2X31_00640, partial [Elusimicrobia bacterium GWB2_63_22]
QSPTGPPGTCENPIYAGSFFLPPGEHAVNYLSFDNVWNAESPKTFHLTVIGGDMVPPETSLIIDGSTIPAGVTAEIAPETLTTISAIDPVSTGTVSGLKDIYFLIDTTLDACGEMGPVVSTAPSGSCQNYLYTGPFSLSIGTHTVYYTAVDNVGNMATVKSARIMVKPDLINPALHPFYELFSAFGAPGSGPGQFNAYDVKFDKDGNALLADSDNLRIQKFSPAGEFISMFTVKNYGHSYFYAPLQVAPCPNGDIWVSDYGTKLMRFTADGTFLREMYIQDMDEFHGGYPKNIVCTAENEIYFLTWANYIFRLDSQGNKLGEIAVSNSGSYLNGLGRDSAGNLYTYHNTTGQIRKYAKAGNLVASWPSATGAGSDMHAGVSVDSFDNIYLSRFGKPLEIYTSTGGFIGATASVLGQEGSQYFISAIGNAYNPRSGDLYLAEGSRVKILQMDFKAPPAPVIVSPPAGATVLVSSPLITGQAEISSLVRIYDYGTLIKELQTNTSGYFAFSLPAEAFGGHSLSARAADAAGNLSEPSATAALRTAGLNAPVFAQPLAGPSAPGVFDTSATVTGDFNGDGMLDVFGIGRASGYNYGGYALYKGLGSGAFVTVSTGAIAGYSDNLEAVAYDFNGDGHLDVVTGMTAVGLGIDYLITLKGRGDGTFDAPQVGDLVGVRPDMLVEDMDKDGLADLVLSASNGVRVYWGNSAGTFYLYTSTPVPPGTHTAGSYSSYCNGGLASADFDGDGNTDLVFRNAVLFGNGRAGFGTARFLALPVPFYGEICDAQSPDLNGDGVPDVALTGYRENKVLSFLNLGQGKFMPAGSVTVNKLAFESVAADLNADGKEDIALSPGGADALIVLAGRGDGTFAGPYTYASGGTPGEVWGLGGLSAGDIDLDGRKDIVMASSILYLPGRTVNSFMSYLNRADVPDWTPPGEVEIDAQADAANGITVRWTAPGDDGLSGRAALYDLRYSELPITDVNAFSAATRVTGLAVPSPAGQPEAATVGGLTGGVTYYFALKTADEAGNTSGLSDSPGVFLKFLFTSTVVVGELPEMTFSASTRAEAELISGVSGPGAVVLGAAAEAGLTLASNLYEIGPEGSYDPPATLTFAYSPAAIAALGLSEDDIGIYEHFSERGWVLLEGQTIDRTAHTISVPVTQISSIFAIFGTVKDRAAPQTSMAVWCATLSGNCRAAGPDGVVYADAVSTISFTAADPVLFGTATGVSFTEFKVDGAADFVKYAQSFTLAPGMHVVAYRSGDYASNLEPLREAKVFFDAEPPVIKISSPTAGAVFNAGRGPVVIAFLLTDNAGPAPSYSGVIRQTADKGSPRGERPGMVAVSSTTLIAPLDIDDGLWRIEVEAEDAAGNSTQAVSGVFEVIHDTIAPVTVLLVGEPKLTDGSVYISSATPLQLSTTDDMLIGGDGQGVGVESAYASLDGGPAAPVTGAVFISEEGAHMFTYYSVDKAGNAESPRVAEFMVDNSAPEVSHVVTSPAFFGEELYLSTSSVIGLSAVEPPSSGAASGLAGIFVAESTDTYAVYAGTFTAPEGAHAYNYYATDRLGNTGAAKTLILKVDGAAPVSTMAFSGAATAGAVGRTVISSYTSMGFVAEDIVSGGVACGVGYILYSVDNGTAAVYASTFTLPEGLHDISYQAVDNVGNTESVRTIALQVGASRPVELRLEPSTINLKSEGQYVEAKLTVSSSAGAAFIEDTICITSINDAPLATPICALPANGNEKNDNQKVQSASIEVQFDRQALINVLSADSLVKLVVEGSFEDGSYFSAEDYLRVINPVRIRKIQGGKVRHLSLAGVDIPAEALKGDTDITVVTVVERAGEQQERAARASERGLQRRGDIYEFGPEGAVFETTVVLVLPYDSLDPGSEKLNIAYWNVSTKDWEILESETDSAEKVVKAKVRHFSLYQVVASTGSARAIRASVSANVSAGPSQEFRLGEVYVYPNPAKNGQAPTIHLECGLADSVNIKIYTVSGREAHEHTITSAPAVLDDGNGLSYAYEYTWNSHIPSGVYYYFIEAERAGKKIKKTGKFAVVR